MPRNEATPEQVAAMRPNWDLITDASQIKLGADAGSLAVEGAQNAENDQGK